MTPVRTVKLLILAVVGAAGAELPDGASASLSSSASVTGTGGAGTPDGGGDPGWQPVSWSPAMCPLEVAQNPNAAVDKLTWRTCPDQAPGCEKVVISWDPAGNLPSGPPSVIRHGSGHRVGLYMSWPDKEARVAVFDGDGTPMVVWRTTDGCPMVSPRLGAEHVWFGAQRAFQPSTYIVERYESLGSTATVKKIEYDGGSQLQDASDTTFALEGLNGDVLTVYDRLTGKATSFTQPLGGNKVAHPVGDVAFFLSFVGFEQPKGWIWRRSSSSVEALVQSASQYVVDIRSDGSTIVWIQVPAKQPWDLFWPQGDLWTSAFATSAAALNPVKRRPAPIVGEVPAAIGEGYYALYSLNDKLLHVYRLSDMQHWSFAAPPQAYAVQDVSYIDADAVWYQTLGGVFRQKLDALGPGDPPP